MKILPHLLLLIVFPLVSNSFTQKVSFHKPNVPRGTRNKHFSATNPSPLAPGDTTRIPELSGVVLLKRDRYIATNRFAVRKGDAAAKFEKRWATRKSRLASLEGFRYFHLMRRVNEEYQYEAGETDEEAQENYVSFTVWNKKSNFSAWRKGEAFKEAHGGTSISAFLSTMVNSALLLRGAPRPAFYDGLLVQSSRPTTVPETVDGWRNVEADGINTLPPECFVVMYKLFVPRENAVNLEQSFRPLEGSVFSCLMRRDASAKGHGVTELKDNEPSYVATSVFESKESFEAMGGELLPPEVATLSSKEPERVLYEGTLVITNEAGA